MNNTRKLELMDPKVSIIIPVYNVRKYLKKSVESVCNQTYKNLDILLVDDGSTDGCSEICDSFARKDSRVRVIHKMNSGISDTRNVGLRNVLGNYLVFVDSDDSIKTVMVERMMNVLVSNSADMVACENDFIYSDRVDSPKTSGKIIQQNTDEALKILLEDRKFRSRTWGRVYKTSLWDGISFPYGKTYEDVSTVYKVYLNAKRIVLLDESLYEYNQRENSIVHKKAYTSLFDLLDARVDRRNVLGEIKPMLLPELNASVMSAVLDIYRRSVLSKNRLTSDERNEMKNILEKYSDRESLKVLSPRYRMEKWLLHSNCLYNLAEERLDKLIIFMKRMGK
ncbi:glycosyltransferase [Levilactobacillus namurensis]|uniref:glycosyltransferase n=1 Tax=Levilactobacillus namurensis TaxID=380393 RepID=UPI001D2D3B8F|nr:glycosyltransferase [Levilactobacillus namurensis]HJE45711.1 glycosyltransferase [Levilactobacillus namurensis]